MERIEKTVFISYRRTNIPWALAIFQNLTQHGYDVFFDYSGIASGDFERVILENITARAHFLVLLTPSALERCDDPADWLRREIETALANQRNIVPLMLEGFDFGAPKISNQLRGELAALKHYNGLRILPDYFDEAMERLRSRYLNVPSNAVLHPTSLSARQAVTQQKAAAEAAPAVQQKELTGSKPEELKADSVRTNPDDSQTYVWIPPGEFLMGCSPSDTECLDNEKPPHTVRITRGFWLGQTPVTVGAYRRFAEKNGVSMPPEPSCNPRWSDSEQPIVRVTWNQARDYCEWAKGRLPTEAEWEYAARAGTAGPRYGMLDAIAWYDNNSGGRTHAVKTKEPSAWGLYDMLGNVWEWVADWYGEDYYRSLPSMAIDPKGPPDGTHHVLRSGSSYVYPWSVRASRRDRYAPEGRFGYIGFRCVREVIP